MSASPDDAQPVFDLIARQAATLCNVPTAAVATFDGTMLHLATQSGFDAAYADAYVSQFPRPVGQDLAMGRAILNRRVEQVEDITAYPGHSFVGVLGHWSVMAVPMLRHDVPLGAITIGRPAIGPFSASLDFSNERGASGLRIEKSVVREQFFPNPGWPRCRQSVARRCSNLKRLNGER